MRSSEKLQNAPPAWKFWHNRRRYVVNFLMLMGTTVMYLMRANLSVAIVSMTDPETGDFAWNSKEQGLVLGSFFYGYIMTQFLGGVIAKRFPAHHVFGFAIGICALLTLVTPIFAINYVALIVIRVIEGLVLGVTFPSAMGVLAKWSPVIERSRMTMICHSGAYFGTILAMSGTGVLSDFYGWQSVFYVSGGIGVTFFVLWLLLVKESPENDPWITDEEKNFILEGTRENSNDKEKVPWIKLFTAIPVWAIVFAQFTHNWGVYTVMTQMPTFLSDTMNIQLSSNGFYSALPYVTSGILGFPSGLLADLLQKHMKTVHVRKLFTTGAFVCQFGFMLCAGFIMSPTASISFLTISMGFATIAMSGFAINFLDIAPQFSSIIFGFANTIGTIPGIVSPLLTGFIVQNKSEDEWRTVFFLTAGIYISGGILYLILGSADPLFPSTPDPPKYSEQFPEKAEKTYIFTSSEKEKQNKK
ncbi:vesicular glutamate transporter 2-like [Culicoides brevitarsis]|uniref:vesicular glutamate transporter 2-like n=1 Tax=Culicoides brevitarsis TaxID=469753 RepID=UPI00307C1679